MHRLIVTLVNHHLAVLYNDIGQYDKAANLMTKSLNLSRGILQENHLGVAIG